MGFTACGAIIPETKDTFVLDDHASHVAPKTSRSPRCYLGDLHPHKMPTDSHFTADFLVAGNSTFANVTVPLAGSMTQGAPLLSITMHLEIYIGLPTVILRLLFFFAIS